VVDLILIRRCPTVCFIVYKYGQDARYAAKKLHNLSIWDTRLRAELAKPSGKNPSFTVRKHGTICCVTVTIRWTSKENFENAANQSERSRAHFEGSREDQEAPVIGLEETHAQDQKNVAEDHAADLDVGVLALELAAREDRVGQTHVAAAPHLAQNLEAVAVDLVREEMLAEIFQPSSNFLLSRLN